MIPITNNNILLNNVERVEQTTKTYYLDIEKNRIEGFCNEMEALKQTIYCILSTERFENIIYSWNYGVEIKNLIGENETYVIPELERVITEALLQDDRIKEVSNFIFSTSSNAVTVAFDVITALGSITIDKKVVIS